MADELVFSPVLSICDLEVTYLFPSLNMILLVVMDHDDLICHGQVVVSFVDSKCWSDLDLSEKERTLSAKLFVS